MNKCDSCAHGMVQLSHPDGAQSFHLCRLCGGTGHERIVQILQVNSIVTDKPMLLGLSSNGALYRRKEDEWVPA